MCVGEEYLMAKEDIQFVKKEKMNMNSDQQTR